MARVRIEYEEHGRIRVFEYGRRDQHIEISDVTEVASECPYDPMLVALTIMFDSEWNLNRLFRSWHWHQLRANWENPHEEFRAMADAIEQADRELAKEGAE